ncbi:MAG: DinB family protein [Anaerolineales bacterium]|nr:DinB family protein [Anaerolineales bacterium]
MNVYQVVQSQYLAALAMMQQVIKSCPAHLWNDVAAKNRFWHVAYHALFYVHLYVQHEGGDFVPWEKHRENYNVMGEQLPWPPHDKLVIDVVYTQADLLDYLALCQQQIRAIVPTLDLASQSSGFSWLPFGKLELQLYSIRHLQLHVGELAERLWDKADIEVGWVGQA